jgi:competence protein ComEA
MKRTVVCAALMAAALVLPGCSASDSRRADRAWDELRGVPSERVELNTASRKELARLPGLNDRDAKRIVDNRPYPNKRALLSRGVIAEDKYDDIEEYVYVAKRYREQQQRRDDQRD